MAGYQSLNGKAWDQLNIMTFAPLVAFKNGSIPKSLEFLRHSSKLLERNR